ncbi:protein sidekick-2-like isoform X2 [Acanthaster planci]|uniref:Protein sidekick-2-like isoform X2 n=1 Tax=Acanthaster planci TaxID=133434 RepID=A0A8B7Y632_ACAPL|nr:protein sidekick-2-like isoform X2 [Acanthaster planci]
MFSMACNGFISLFVIIAFLTGKASALVGTLSPLDPIIEVGSDLVLNCTLNASSNGGRTAQDVIWHRDSVQLSPDTYVSLSDTVSQLTLTNVTFSDWHIYYCFFPDVRFYKGLASEVSVGKKPLPPILECTIPSPDTYRCRWQEGTFTQIKTRHEFMFRHDGAWHRCPSPEGNSCSLPLERVVELNQHVKVISENALGTATTEKRFHMHRDVVVNQPRNVQVTKVETETSLRVTWSVPDEWPRMEESLVYKLRFKKDDCMMLNQTCCCWLETTDILTSRILTLRDLDPYTCYSVEVSAKYLGAREENWSEWSEVTGTTREIPPIEIVQDLEITVSTNNMDPAYKRDVSVYWIGLNEEGRHGQLIGYKIVVWLENSREVVQENVTHQNHFMIKGLQKFKGYLVKVSAYNHAGNGPWSSIHVEDLTQGAPNAPDEVRVVALTTTSIRVEWSGPNEPNGYIIQYIVQWERIDGDRQSYNTFNSSQLSYVIEGLSTFAMYEVGVKTVYSHGESEVQFVRDGARTLEGVPDAPPTNVEVEAVPNQPDRLTVMWEQPPTESINGILLGYVISLCKTSLYDKIRRKCTGELRQINETRPDILSNTLTHLQPSTSYQIWIAAYTKEGTGLDSKPVEGKTADETQGIVLMAVVIPFAILFCLCLFGIFVWQFRPHEDQSKRESYETTEKFQQVQSDKVVSSPHTAVIAVTSLQDNCECISEWWEESSWSVERRCICFGGGRNGTNV